MNIWIITTGSSDVQLETKDRWSTLHSKVRSQLKIQRQFSLSESEQNGQKRWLVPSRAMGVVYGQAIADHYIDLDFPLLNSFSSYLKKEKIELNRIILLLTDQSDVVSGANKGDPSHPYWQDTCTLKPLLQHHLKIAFPDVEMDSVRDFPVLKPKSGSVGLDDWNEVLTLVQKELPKLGIPEDATVYVSHQAGTPAISSAVQFESLLRFGQRVKFLVSSEHDSNLTRILDRSTYLSGIRKQEAKTLLDNHDYFGVKELLNPYITSEIRILLEAAIKWNFAKFKEFASELLQYPNSNFVEEVQERTKEENWWWTAYEAAYLGVVRLEQGNTVEAMFHSFRAFEGLAIEYAKRHGSNKYGRKVFKYLRHQKQADWNNHPYIKTLIDLDNPDELTRNDILDRRNNLFHNLLGQEIQDVLNAWASDEEEWQARVLGCLNFVSEQTQFDSIKYLKDVSLMAKLHQKLEEAINSY